MIGRTISHYHILRQIGEGGMGVVYVAEDTQLGRRVAVKIPHASTNEKHYRARFLREARSVSMLSHRNIAAVHDYGETDEGQPFIVMELVTGPTLADLINKSELNLARAVEIIRDVGCALSEAHRYGIVHRDVKPTNVLINERGEVKVLDFGLAKHLEDGLAAASSPEAQTLLSTRTRSDVVIGTPLYLSPEQARGAQVDRRSDLFALGALLYECVAGRPAFSGSNVIEIGAQVLHVDPPPPSQFNSLVPAELDRVTLKALSKKPEERYQSADEMVADLDDVLAMLSPEDAARTRRLPTPAGGARSSAFVTTISDTLRRPRLSPLAFAGAVAVILFGVWAYGRWSAHTLPPPPPDARKEYERGLSFLRDGSYDQASKALGRAIGIHEKYALARAALAEAWMELDYLDRANAELVSVSSLVPDRAVLDELDALYLDALKHTALREFAQAVEAYAEIVRLKPEDPQARVDLGRAYERNNEPKKAGESYLQAVNLDRDQKYATPFLRLGILYGRQSEQASAVANFEKALSLYGAAKNLEGQAEVFYQRGYLYRIVGKIPEARAQLEQALRMADAAGSHFHRIRTLLTLSTVAYAENDSARAEAYAQEAVETARTGGMENLTARGLVDLGNVYFARGDHPLAEKYLQQGLEYAQRSKARDAEAAALINLGSLRLQQSKPDEAIAFVNRALNFYRQGNYRREVSSGLLMLGRANRMKGDYDAARRAFEQQLQLAQQAGGQAQAATAHEGAGTVLAYQEHYPEALEHFGQKYAISKSLGDQKGMCAGLAERGSVLWQLGRYADARAALEQAEALADRPDGGYKDWLIHVHSIRAELELSERQFGKAKTHAERVLALSQTGPQQPDSLVAAERVLCLAQALSGNSQGGRRSCEGAVERATRSGDPFLISNALLSLAQARLEGGDAQGALDAALRAQESFEKSGRLSSGWLAWVVAARASQRVGDRPGAREYAARATAVLAKIQQQWDAETYKSYLDRQDVRYYQAQLSLD